MRSPATLRCSAHPSRLAISECSVCGRTVCEVCLGQIDQTDYCPEHFVEAEEGVRADSYHLPPLPVPASLLEVLIGVWAIAGAVAPWLPWYTQRVALDAGGGSQPVELSGWEAGGTAGVASVVLLAAGIALGLMVAARLIRPRLVTRAAVSRASIALGAVECVLLAIRVLMRWDGVATGLYLSSASAGLCLYIGAKVGGGKTKRPRR